MSCRNGRNEEFYIKDVGRPQGDRRSECVMVNIRLVCWQRPRSITSLSDRSNTVDVFWYHTGSMKVCSRFSVLVFSCVSAGLTLGRSALQGVL